MTMARNSTAGQHGAFYFSSKVTDDEGNSRPTSSNSQEKLVEVDSNEAHSFAYACFASFYRFLWVAVVITCTFILLLQVTICVNKLRHPVITTQTQVMFNSSLDFPAVTVCQRQGFKLSQLKNAWQTIKKTTKKKQATVRKSLMMTGGGPPIKSEDGEHDTIVDGVLSDQMPLTGILDNDHCGSPPPGPSNPTTVNPVKNIFLTKSDEEEEKEMITLESAKPAEKDEAEREDMNADEKPFCIKPKSLFFHKKEKPPSIPNHKKKLDPRREVLQGEIDMLSQRKELVALQLENERLRKDFLTLQLENERRRNQLYTTQNPANVSLSSLLNYLESADNRRQSANGSGD
ncbi:unnamed protein product [Cyprideis torosa]|uniref:Uncharacterized protein n=1 Tax=Cyprideis torosa TaxID=163714 RepID=A0A7R8WL82_9CRUS|nr:unnamed protein product [Cyprideis torosa]CAG0904055.1 unnamed protein product [Cyprideis torosa]